MRRTFYTTENIKANQRTWLENRYKPIACKECKKPLVFMKNHRWNYVACDAVKKIVNDGDTNGAMAILDEDGIVTTSGRRVGWPVHICSINNAQLAMNNKSKVNSKSEAAENA